MAEPRFPLLAESAKIRFSKPSPLKARPARATLPPGLRCLDCAVPIFCYERAVQCAAPESARALANVPNPQPARARTSSDAFCPSPDASDKLLRGRDLLSDLRS